MSSSWSFSLLWTIVNKSKNWHILFLYPLWFITGHDHTASLHLYPFQIRLLFWSLQTFFTFFWISSWLLSNGLKGQYLSENCLSDQIRSVAQSCPTLCDPMNRSTPGLPVHHQLLEFTETHIHWVSDAIQPSHPLLFPSPPAPNPSQHQSLFQWVNSSHQVAKVLDFQL